MPDFSSSKGKTSDLSSLLFHFCFSIFSHPLYFSYFIFFSPYILKLVSFLSPLFITTTLLLLTLFTVSPNFLSLDANGDSDESEFSDSKLGFLLSNLHTLILWLHSKSNQKDEESGYLEELEAYLVMFQASIFQALEAKPEENNSPECLEEADPVAEVKSLKSLFQESEELEDLGNHQREEKASGEMKVLENLFREDEVHQKEAKLLVDSEEEIRGKTESDTKLEDGEGEKKVLESSKLQKEEENQNEERKVKIIGPRSGIKVMSSKSQRLLEASLGSPENNWIYSSESNNLGSFGSMRKEKEWRRTLACKLFEERHNNSNFISNNINGSESGEGMDSLWETYNETESNKPKNNSSNKKKIMTILEKSSTKKSSETNYYEPEDEEDEEEEEEEEGIKLCCLQALKFSTGKMNLGMGKPNLMKISKAFKGFGWLHHHVGKHGKKG